MNEMITIPRVEYDRLIEAAEDAADIQAVMDYRNSDEVGDGLPHEFMKRLINGDSPLAVFREWRGYNQSSLGKASKVNRVQIADIEAGRNNGSVATLKKLSETLGVSIDELV